MSRCDHQSDSSKPSVRRMSASDLILNIKSCKKKNYYYYGGCGKEDLLVAIETQRKAALANICLLFC